VEKASKPTHHADEARERTEVRDRELPQGTRGGIDHNQRGGRLRNKIPKQVGRGEPILSLLERAEISSATRQVCGIEGASDVRPGIDGRETTDFLHSIPHEEVRGVTANPAEHIARIGEEEDRKMLRSESGQCEIGESNGKKGSHQFELHDGKGLRLQGADTGFRSHERDDIPCLDVQDSSERLGAGIGEAEEDRLLGEGGESFEGETHEP
jgi:hypothetical protein